MNVAYSFLPWMVTLSWDPDRGGAEGTVIVESSCDGGDWSVVGTVNAPQTHFDDNSFTSHHLYSYRLRSASHGNLSAYSEVVSIPIP